LLRPTSVYTAKGIFIGSAIFAQLKVAFNTESVAILCIYALRAGDEAYNEEY